MATIVCYTILCLLMKIMHDNVDAQWWIQITTNIKQYLCDDQYLHKNNIATHMVHGCSVEKSRNHQRILNKLLFECRFTWI